VVNCWVGFDVASGLTDGKLSQPNIVHAHPIIAPPATRTAHSKAESNQVTSPRNLDLCQPQPQVVDWMGVTDVLRIRRPG